MNNSADQGPAAGDCTRSCEKGIESRRKEHMGESKRKFGRKIAFNINGWGWMIGV